MSQQEFLLDVRKPWLVGRCEDLTVDDVLTSDSHNFQKVINQITFDSTSSHTYKFSVPPPTTTDTIVTFKDMDQASTVIYPTKDPRYISTETTLSASDGNNLIIVTNDVGANYNVILPLISSIPLGTKYKFMLRAAGASNCYIVCSGSDTFGPGLIVVCSAITTPKQTNTYTQAVFINGQSTLGDTFEVTAGLAGKWYCSGTFYLEAGIILG
jgi:hypothetical protein